MYHRPFISIEFDLPGFILLSNYNSLPLLWLAEKMQQSNKYIDVEEHIIHIKGNG